MPPPGGERKKPMIKWDVRTPVSKKADRAVTKVSRPETEVKTVRAVPKAIKIKQVREPVTAK